MGRHSRPASSGKERPAASGSPKYVVCNADESEPGTFKDRVLLLDDPHSVIEGMLIAGYAIGASRGYIYLRGEYPYILNPLENAVKEASAAGFLGENVLGSGFSFDIEIRLGAGAYICGEETALFESIEGKRGFPARQAAVSHDPRSVRQADGHQQRRDPLQRPR